MAKISIIGKNKKIGKKKGIIGKNKYDNWQNWV